MYLPAVRPQAGGVRNVVSGVPAARKASQGASNSANRGLLVVLFHLVYLRGCGGNQLNYLSTYIYAVILHNSKMRGRPGL